MALVLGAAAAVAYVATNVSADRLAIRGLAEAERKTLYTRTWDDLRQSCGLQPPAALTGHCRELASFLSRFEECRGDCEAMVRRYVAPVPTR